MKKHSKIEEMSNATAIIWAFAIFFGLIIFVLIFVGLFSESSGYDNTESVATENVQITTTELTLGLKEEICREIKVYFEYCWETGISATDCGKQAGEKIARIFDINGEQAKEAWDYCGPKIT